mgnify:CR=1 FL=1
MQTKKKASAPSFHTSGTRYVAASKEAATIIPFEGKRPTAQEQLSAQWLQGGVAKAMGGTAEFLKEQGRIPAVKPSYAAYVTDAYVRKAVGK